MFYHRHPSAKPDAGHLLLIHGWGISGRVWQGCITELVKNFHLTIVDLPGFGESRDVDNLPLTALLDELDGVMVGEYSVLGFSLGGMLAIQLAQLFPQRVQKVITIGANALFTQQAQWPQAIPVDTYQQFYALAEQSPALILKRFLLLQAKGSGNEKAVVNELRLLADQITPSSEHLCHTLNLLEAMDNREPLKKLSQPVMCLLGDGDQLVPAQVAGELEQLGAVVNVFADAGHAVFVSHPAQCCETISNFLGVRPHEVCEIQKKLNKIKVAKSFAKAAATYDDVAGLQRDIGHQLLCYLPPNIKTCERAVDLGCGTGYFLPKLQQQCAPEQLVGLDLADGMLNYAREHRVLQSTVWLCADAESLPLADQSVDIIFSSLAIQWCEAAENLFNEIYRVLKPGGQFVFATLGPETLHELRSAWQQVDDDVHVNQFLPEPVLKGAIAASGLQLTQWQQRYEVLQYQKLTQLTKELKGIGAHNVNAGRPVGLTGKKRIKAFREAYETQRDHQGQLPATYQVWYGVLEKCQ